MSNLAIIEIILRNRQTFFNEIRDGIDIDGKIQAMLVACFAFLAGYGFVMGASHSLLQAVVALIKLPVLFLATLAICASSLHFFNILFGSKQTLLQTVALILTAISTTAVLLFSLAPITLFFLLSSSQYDFFMLLNVVFFAVAGALGVMFLQEGMRIVTEAEGDTSIQTRRMIFALWVILYGFVGSQMAWTLSPFIGSPEKAFILFNPSDGNFYTYVLESLRELLS
jgi:hypothetical protein